MGDNVTNTASTTPSFQEAASTVTRDPWSGAVPYLGQIAGGASGLFGNTQAETNTMGGSYAQPYQTAINALSGPGVNASQQGSLDHLNSIANGQFANNNAYANYGTILQNAQKVGNPNGALSSTQNQILDDNAARIAARQASLYSGAGRYGSEGAGIGMARGIAETNNPLIAQFNQQGIQNYLQGQQLGLGASQADAATRDVDFGRMQNASLQNLQAQDAAQGRQQGWAQQSPALFNMALSGINRPWEDLGKYAQTLSAFNPVLANAGSAVTNASQRGISSTTGQTSTPTPWTTYGGLGLAGIGLLSDRRMKTDIKKVGKDPWNGLDMYKYRYKGQPKNTPKMVGPMAQDVQRVAPEAVGELPGGILYIKGQR